MKVSSHNPYYRFGLDTSVWWVMITFIGLALGLVGYRKVTYEPCIEFTISSKSFSGSTNDHYYSGEDIRFTASAKTVKSLVWDFGDSTEVQKANTVVSHSYTKDGKI